MVEWFNGLEMFERIYWMVAIPASLVFLIVLIATFIGGDMDTGDVDTDGGDLDGEIGFQFFTFKNLVGFFTIFSWVGIGCIRSNISHPVVIIISLICGLMMMLAMSTLFYLMTKLVEDGTMKISNALGKTGKVYLPIEASMGGFGKVQINIQGSIHEIQAMTGDEQELKVGTIVQVEKIIDGNILLVTGKLA